MGQRREAVYAAAFVERFAYLAADRPWRDALRDMELLASAHSDATALADLAAVPCLRGELAQRPCFKCRAIPGQLHGVWRP